MVISPKTVLRLIRTIDSQIRTPFRMLDVGCINGFYENDPFRYFHHFSKKILIGIEAVPYSNPQYSKIIQVCVAPTAGTYPFYIPFFSTWASFLEPDFEKIQQDSRIAQYYQSVEKRLVPMQNFSELIGHDFFDILKFNLLGGEDLLFSLSDAFFQKLSIVSIITSNITICKQQKTLPDVLHFLSSKGFFLLHAPFYENIYGIEARTRIVAVKAPYHIQTLPELYLHCFIGAACQKINYLEFILRSYQERNGKQPALQPIYRMFGLNNPFP